jgi:hypothetical protein
LTHNLKPTRFQPLNLRSEKPVSKFAVKCNLYHYPSAYSNTFAEKSAAAVLMGISEPRAIIADAHANTQLIGSSTAVVAVLKQLDDAAGTRVLIGNVGDAVGLYKLKSVAP